MDFILNFTHNCRILLSVPPDSSTNPCYGINIDDNVTKPEMAGDIVVLGTITYKTPKGRVLNTFQVGARKVILNSDIKTSVTTRLWDPRDLPAKLTPFIFEFTRLGLQNLFEGASVTAHFTAIVED